MAGVTEVWMVRHTAVDVPPGTCYGRTDVPLRKSFADEAAALGRTLAGVLFDEVWSSPLSRCVSLARACGFGGVTMNDDRLLELDFGEWEGRLFDEIDDPALQSWYDDWLHARPTGGESFDEQCARVAAFLEELRQGNARRVLVFTHGGVIAAAMIHAGILEPAEVFSHIPPYGSITKVTLSTP